jgi:CheY-like chemotaxis protein
MKIEKNKKILVVDDCDLIRELFAAYCKYLPYEVTIASNKQEALEAFEGAMQSQRKFDLAILDFMMPDILGPELLQLLRARDQQLKAILITGYAQHEGVQNAEQAGFEKILFKPLDLDTLETVLRETLSSS